MKIKKENSRLAGNEVITNSIVLMKDYCINMPVRERSRYLYAEHSCPPSLYQSVLIIVFRGPPPPHHIRLTPPHVGGGA